MNKKSVAQGHCIGAIILSSNCLKLAGIHFVALILVSAHMLFTKPMTKRAGAKQSYLLEERAKKTSNPTTQTDADAEERRDPVKTNRKYLSFSCTE